MKVMNAERRDRRHAAGLRLRKLANGHMHNLAPCHRCDDATMLVMDANQGRGTCLHCGTVMEFTFDMERLTAQAFNIPR